MEERQSHPVQDHLTADDRPAAKPRKRRSIISVFLRLAVAVAILAGAVVYGASMIASKPEAIKRQARERSFTVAVMTPEYGTFNTHFRAFGQVQASRTFEVRAQVVGEVIELAPNLAVGNLVAKGTQLVAIDSTDYDGKLVEAQAAEANARLSLAEAEEAYKLQELKLAAAKTSLAAAQTDLERAQVLNQNGNLTDKELDTRKLTVSDRQQSVSEIESGLFTLQAQIDRQRASIISAQLSLEQARRDLENTRITAPFDGIVVSENLSLGSYVTANENVASLYDPTALDVSFTISDLQYGQLISEGLEGREVEVSWDIAAEPIKVAGEITRAAAEIDSTTGGVKLFARLTGDNASQLRPGTFVEVQIKGPSYERTLRVPETALYENDHIYTIRDGRMAKVDARIMTRDNDYLIISAEVPEGERIITTRLSQAGEGVAVSVEGEEESAPTRGAGSNENANANAGANARLPEGAVRRDDGSVLLPNGNIRHPDGRIEQPDGTIISAEEAASQRGNRPGGGQRRGGN